jgi:hypothetical protein
MGFNPLKNEKERESTFVSNAPQFPEEHCFLEGFHVLPVCMPGKSNV